VERACSDKLKKLVWLLYLFGKEKVLCDQSLNDVISSQPSLPEYGFMIVAVLLFVIMNLNHRANSDVKVELIENFQTDAQDQGKLRDYVLQFLLHNMFSSRTNIHSEPIEKLLNSFQSKLLPLVKHGELQVSERVKMSVSDSEVLALFDHDVLGRNLKKMDSWYQQQK
jgi:cellulose biosynthesis protein BcsQ